MSHLSRWIELTTARTPSGKAAVNLCICAWDGKTPPAPDAVPAYRDASRPTKAYNAAKAVTSFIKGVHLQGTVDPADPEEDSLLTAYFEPYTGTVTMWDMEDAVRAMRTLFNAAWPKDVQFDTVGDQVTELLAELDLAGLIIHHPNGQHQAVTDRQAAGTIVDELIERLRAAMTQEVTG